MKREPDAIERSVPIQPTAPSPRMVVALVAREDEPDAERLAASLPSDVATVVLGTANDTEGVSRLAPGSIHRIAASRGASFVAGSVAPAAGGGDSAIARTLLALAEAYEDRAVVVMFGTSTAEEESALAALHRAGGLAVRRHGAAGFALPPAIEGAPERILALEEVSAAVAEAARPLEAADPRTLEIVLSRLEPLAGPSVRHQRPNLLTRRIGRRIALTGASDVADYLARLRSDDTEARALRHDLLIGVTRFFRDADVWRVLAAEVLPDLVARRAGGSIRLWVPGVSTGEEAYSYAILLADEMDRQGVTADVTIFATDLDPAAIETARAGVFDLARTGGLSAEQLGRHFVAEGGKVRVSRRLREMIVFAIQDLLADPPFSEVDLVSCRNVLIYFDAAGQQRMLDALGYAVVADGVIVLGLSEPLGDRVERFAAVSTEARIYRRRNAQPAPPIPAASTRPFPPAVPGDTWPEGARRALLDVFVPPSVIVARDRTVRFVHGSVRAHLAIPEGEPTNDLLDLVDPRLRMPLKAALDRAAMTGQPTTAVHRDEVAIPVAVRPLAGLGETLFLVSFGGGQAEGTADLAAQLAAARAELQTTVEELESANEELRAANDEVMSGNAQLHRANVDLEASRDDLRRVNERLSAANSALETTVAELRRSNGDLSTLLSGIDVATLFLDRDLAVRRYTPRAGEVFGLRATDVGRPLSAVSLVLDDPALLADAGRVLERLAPVEREVRAGDRWLMRRIVPDRTGDHVIEGVLVTAWDVTQLKETAERLARRERQQAAVAALGEAATGAAANIAALLDAAVATVSEHLDAPLVKVLELAPGWDHLRLRSGVGWHEGLVGSAKVPSDAGSQGGYTLRSGRPVVVEDLAVERRFSGPSILLEHGVVSGLSVTIGPTDTPWGVIGAHTTERRRFTADDVNFLQSIANILFATVERQRVARAYRIAAERLELAVGVGGLATWDWDFATDEVVWSESHYLMLGYRRPELRSTLAAWRARVHPDDLPLAEAAIAQALEGDGQFICEYRLIPQPGVERWVEGRGRTALDSSGKPVRMFGVLIDITERKRSEQRQTLLLNELDHRVRNTLANITALARQTKGRATSVAGYVADFTDRLAAIGRAHTLLSEARWAGASLSTLIEEEFAALRRSNQVMLDGPDVDLAQDDAQLFALAFHELAVNAVHHGALRSSAGTLAVRWRVQTIDTREMLAIDWFERGTTPVETPRAEGFGSLVLTRLLPVQMDTTVTLDYTPEGLHCRILVPRARVEVAAARLPHGVPEGSGATVSLVGRRILIVEDSMLTALDIEAMLRDEGAEVVAIAGTVEEAEARVGRGGIDIALLDRNLAGTMVDGVARRLAAAGIPFVFMTGYNSQAIPPDLRHAPVLSKPFEVETLLAALGEVL